MDKKLKIIGVILIIIVFGSLIIFFLKYQKSDSVRFMEEYYYLDIRKDNPFIYKTANEIMDMINNKETFLVYFGLSKSDLVRENLPYLIKALDDNKIDKVYYVNIEGIREIKKGVNGNVKIAKMGTMGYYALLDYFNDYLEDYIIKDMFDNLNAGKHFGDFTFASISNGKINKIFLGGSNPYNNIIDVIGSIEN